MIEAFNHRKMAKKCFICKSSDVNDLELGEFLDCNDVHVHYFCLLLTTSLQQNGEDDEGLLGFLISDVKKCVLRLKKNICYVCHKPYANIECSKTKCSRKFHTLCGLNKCLNTFTEKYVSFCEHHHHLQTKDLHKETENCIICYDAMDKYNPITSIQPICCKSGWMHKRCVSHYAKNSGYFCKCPLCNNDEKFRNFIAHRGVFIPDQDAAWELVPNAYSELLERPEICQATKCCASRRTVRNQRNKMKTCTACGSYIAHIKCWFGYSSFVARDFICNNCTVINNQNEDVAAEAMVNQKMEDKEPFVISDDDDDDSDKKQNKVNERCNAYLKRPSRDSDSDTSGAEVKELRGRKIKLNKKKDFDGQSEIIWSHDDSNSHSTSEYTSINSTKALDHQMAEKNRSIANKKRNRKTIKDNTIDWDAGENFNNSNTKIDVRKLRERKIKINTDKEFDVQSETSQSLDSNFNSSVDLPKQSTSKFNRRKKRRRITMRDDDDEMSSTYSDQDEWKISTIKRYRLSTPINTSDTRLRCHQENKSYGILSDISNDNGNSSNSVATIFGDSSHKNRGSNSKRSSKRKNTKSDGLNQTKIDMYFKKLPY